MAGIADGLDDATIAALATHYAGAPEAVKTSPPWIVTHGVPARNIPACVTCHQSPLPARDAFPRLTGQYPAYLAAQLRLFVADPFARGGGPFAELMHKAALDLTEAEIDALAQWYGAE